MKNILNTVFQGNADQACEHILGIYTKKGFCIVNYLYFANVSGKKLFDAHHTSYAISGFQDALLPAYKIMNPQVVYKVYQDAIIDADVVLPDGIALQLFNFCAKRKRLQNLNGTDFCPYFLSHIKQHHSTKHMNVILYGTHPHLLEKTRKFLLKQGYTVIYAQDGYTNMDRSKLELALKGTTNDINILLVARTTPEYPIQEIRTLANKEKIHQHRLIVLNQGGTFDFWVGEQKRPPRIIRKLKGERLRRLISDPKRNIKKVWNSLALFRYIFVYLLLKNR